MKNFNLLIITLLLPLTYQCAADVEQPIELDPITTTAVETDYEDNVVLDIDLATITNNYVNLSSYDGQTVHIGGQYIGDRVVLQNVSNVEIVFHNCHIESTHAEDALVFADASVSNLIVEGDGLHLSGGGITFWGHLDQVQLRGGTITNGHTGIRATQDLAHRHVSVSNWHISHMTHEGIYLGVSQDTDKDNQHFHVFDNTIENTGWDAIQVGNVQQFYIYNNSIKRAGISQDYGQDYGATINPGSLGYFYQNEIVETAKPIQILESRVFFHAP
ncbi:MAG: right-handed parallel beta-helix repeat-containing protein [Bacteroidota bacterium]